MSLKVTNTLTGATHEIPIDQSATGGSPTVRAAAFKEVGVQLYDPGYTNTACASSEICFIDGDEGLLSYRGYSLEDLCEHCSFLDVAYLLIYGELPDKMESAAWETTVLTHTFVHEDMLQMMKSFRYDAHPMGMLMSSVSALSTFYPEANPALAGADVFTTAEGAEAARNKQIYRILGKFPTLAACCYRQRIGRPYNHPAPASNMSYTEHFLYMLDRLNETNYRPHPRLAKVLDVLFIIHADHELNCSTAAVRHLGSSGVDPDSAIAGGCGALYGPSHGGANEAVVRMLEEIGDVSAVPDFLEGVKSRKRKLMGFGHRVYRNYDPRAKIIKKYVDEVFDILGVRDPLLQVALELERQALADPFFASRKLFPNVDFYSGLIYKALGFPTDFFPILFAIPRCAGWLAHWSESLVDKERRIVRPRQRYTGLSGMRVNENETRTSSQFGATPTGDQQRLAISKKKIEDLEAKRVRLQARL